MVKFAAGKTETAVYNSGNTMGWIFFCCRTGLLSGVPAGLPVRCLLAHIFDSCYSVRAYVPAIEELPHFHISPLLETSFGITSL